MAGRLAASIHRLFPTQSLGMAQGTGSFCAGRIFERMGPMGLDVNTLFLVTIYVEAMLGLLLLFAWIQNSGIRAVAWWGCAHLLRAGSVVLFGMYGSVSGRDLDRSRQRRAVHRLRRDLVGRAGVRRPRRRSRCIWSAARCCGFWSAARRAFVDSLDAKVLLASGIITAYTWATAYEFWRGRSEPLVSRWPAIFMLFAHGALFLLRTPLSQVLPWSPTNQVFDSVWLTVLSFEALLFTIAIAFILLAMAKERTELRHKTAALVDPLTGIANRRAFLEEVIALSKRQEAEGRVRPRCCSPTSTISSRSTIASATPWATACCRFSPRRPAPSSAPTT